MSGAGTAVRCDVAVDVGGTFTDVVVVDGSGGAFKAKTLSTPPDYAKGVLTGIRLAMDQSDGAAIEYVLHGSTVATNAILEGRGSTPALVTTKGFRDVLELGTGRRPRLYDLSWKKPPVLVPRRFRFELRQRILANGDLEPAAADGDIAAVANQIKAAGVRSVAVCLINSYRRPDEERRVAAVLRKVCSDVTVTASVDLSLEIGEFERTSTAVVNAYVRPVVQGYLTDLDNQLRASGIETPFYVMRSNGALIRARDAAATPVHLIESGPAAGVIATKHLVKRLGIPNAIAFDMGGTTAKASLIENGEPHEVPDFEVGAGMNATRGMRAGGGIPVKTPTLDIAEVGAGGGSVVWVDRGGAARVGPHSAGSNPGPACYGAGGMEPTLSDAALLLGYLNPTSIAGGSQSLDRSLAERALKPVATKLALSTTQMAYGAYQIAIAHMTSLLKSVTSQRGRDPRDSVLIAFGGAGPAYGALLARELGIKSVIVPVAPGLFSATGLLASDPQYVQSRPLLDRQPDSSALNAVLTEMERELRRLLTHDGHDQKSATVDRFLQMNYKGQRGTLNISIDPHTVTGQLVDVAVDAFVDEHVRTYGFNKAREMTEITSARVRVTCKRHELDVLTALAGETRGAKQGHAPQPTRAAYFGPTVGLVSTPVIRRHHLKETNSTGPLIVEEMDSTIVIPPDASARLDRIGNVVIEP